MLLVLNHSLSYLRPPDCRFCPDLVALYFLQLLWLLLLVEKIGVTNVPCYTLCIRKMSDATNLPCRKFFRSSLLHGTNVRFENFFMRQMWRATNFPSIKILRATNFACYKCRKRQSFHATIVLSKQVACHIFGV